MRSAQGAERREGKASVMAAKPKKRMGLLAAVLILVLLFAFGHRLLRLQDQLDAARAEQSELALRLAEQKQENASLEAALERAEDPEYLQELAREQLGMVSPGQKDFYDVSN